MSVGGAWAPRQGQGDSQSSAPRPASPRGAIDAVLSEAYDFLVDGPAGEAIGVVDDIEFDAGRQRPMALLVACDWRGSRVLRIPVADVDEIRAHERRLILAPNATCLKEFEER